MKLILINNNGWTKEYCLLDSQVKTDYKFNCINCSELIKIDIKDASNFENLKLGIEQKKFDAFGGIGTVCKIQKCEKCYSHYFIGIGYLEPNNGRDVYILNNIIQLEESELKKEKFNTYDFLNEDENLYEYFLNSLNNYISKFEFDHKNANSASSTLYYVEKSKFKNFTEGLVNLIIPEKLRNGYIAISEDSSNELKFISVKSHLELNDYYNTNLTKVNKDKFIEELKIFPTYFSDKFNHLIFSTTEKKWLKSEIKIENIIENNSIVNNEVLFSNGSSEIEFYVETRNYYLRYVWSRG